MSVESSALNVERSAPRGAVFLSYARDDVDAARRIAEALRGFGVEVWFDQNELRGGDAWDAKLRTQIRTCTLFMPVISATTQARSEGYFRREWKLAVERTHDMAAGRAFLVPVVIDDTAEMEALVPEEFMRVQWTRLAGGAPTPQFVEQVKRLLAGNGLSGMGVPPMSGTAKHARDVRAAADLRAHGRDAHATAEPNRRGRRALMIGAVLAVVGAAAFFVLRKTESSVPPPAGVVAKDSPAPASTAAPAPSAKSIAVLPFENLSPDPNNAFFADGMHDEVITALAKIHDLKVISRTSVMAYRRIEGRNLRQIAGELGVGSVIEGSVQRAGDRVKVIVQLIDARTDQHMWADTYTENVTDAFTIQSKLAAAITTSLKATLSPQEKSLIARRPTENQEAYDLYLRARAVDQSGQLFNQRNRLEGVVALYEQALAKDPRFLQAYVQLSLIHGRLYWFGHLDPTPARREKVRQARDAAVRLAPDAPETRLAVGAYAYMCENDWAPALAEFEMAARALPNDAQVHYFIGIAQRRLGRLEENLASFARAIELDPRDGLCPPEQLLTLLALRRVTEVRKLAERYRANFPENSFNHLYLAVARFELEGDRETYFRAIEARPIEPGDPGEPQWPYAVAMARGDLAAARRALADPRVTFINSAGSVITEPVALHRALVAFLSGEKERARALADEAIAAYQAGAWSRRQESWVLTGTALAHALAGRPDEALRLAREGLALEASRDAFLRYYQQERVGRIYAVLEFREEAFATLRKMMTEPCPVGPNQLRLDLVWSRLKDDPRFEEILSAMKAL